MKQFKELFEAHGFEMGDFGDDVFFMKETKDETVFIRPSIRWEGLWTVTRMSDMEDHRRLTLPEAIRLGNEFSSEAVAQ